MDMDKDNLRSGLFNHNWLRQREIGCKPSLGLKDSCMKSLYSNIIPSWTWDDTESHLNAMPGGIFNLEFSPDGSLLVAACEKRSILMFDPLSRKLIHTVNNAHLDCVNCVRFLDSRVFATCSDDSTVALWDARNLRSRVRTLQGHSNWVKNIEFSHSDGLLVTSGFDGSIYTWDINSYTESGFVYKRVFHTNGLMRTRLNPDGTKMIICTTGGYLILIHNLDLSTLREDLDGFKPNMYRLMQLSQTTIPVAATFSHLFSRKRKSNRIEFVTDFPEGDDAEVVSSLQIHPQGWCALSRNISNDESSEWTCVHDIQEPQQEVEEEAGRSTEPETEDNTSPPPNDESSEWTCVHDIQEPQQEVEEEAGRSVEPETEDNTSPSPDVVEGMFVIGSDARARVVNTNPETRQRAYRRMRLGGSRDSPFRGFPSVDPVPSRESNIVVTSTDVWEALVAIREARVRRERNRAEERRVDGSGILMPGQEPHTRFRIVRMSSGLSLSDTRPTDQEEETDQPSGSTDSPSLASIVIRYRRSQPSGSQEESVPEPEEAQPSTSSSRTIVILGSNTPTTARTRASTRIKVPKNHKIHKNICRLSHFIQEPNIGRGFIKELCFSSDGRLICSPFGFGVRLLAFSPNCSELSTCAPSQGPVKLFEVGTNLCHRDVVVSTKFSPRHCLLVSGCLTGRIVWHQPTL